MTVISICINQAYKQSQFSDGSCTWTLTLHMLKKLSMCPDEFWEKSYIEVFSI